MLSNVSAICHNSCVLSSLMISYKDVAYADTREHTFWAHFDPSRLSVPRFVYSLCI